MKRKIIVAALTALFSGLTFAAGDTGSTDQQGGYQSQTGAGADQQMNDRGGAAAQDQAGSREDRTGTTEPSVGGEAPVTKHQAETTREVTQRFDQLDANHDGKISYEEAQAMPELKSYWEQHGKDQNAQMDQSEFAQFESQLQTGTDMYKSNQGGPEGLPATKHQRETTGQEKGASPNAPDSGTSGGTENRSDQYSR